MLVLGILQARTSSKRYKNKVMKKIFSKTLLEIEIERILNSKKINHLVVATSTGPSDDKIFELCNKINIDCYRGSLSNVLCRFYNVIKIYKPDHIVRLTADCPLIDPKVIDKIIKSHLKNKSDYTSNILKPTYPDGIDVEVVRSSSIIKAYNDAKLSSDKEHVTSYINSRPKMFNLINIKNDFDESNFRLTVDYKEDYQLIKKIFENFKNKKNIFYTEDVLKFLKKNPKLIDINKKYTRNEGFFYQKKMINNFNKSNKFLYRALRTIPLASQTFSKSITQYPLGISPYYISKAKGSKIWDIDGNKYIDFVNSLLSISIGYQDKDVDEAVKKQMKNGVIFSMPHEIEIEVSELICKIIPCAENVRFAKNGSDSTSAAIRLSRAYTGREHIAVCGYHGWQDWYIASTTRNLGVPKADQKLIHTFKYNNLDSLNKIFEKYKSKIAAVILEPMNTDYPKDNFLKKVQKITKQNKAVLVFDETITGFRWSLGGAQEYFGVTPDLATFGKGIANGYPLSLLAGKRKIMKLMEKIFFSTTFGGETLSLTAAKTVINKMINEPVIETINNRGKFLKHKLINIIKNNNLSDIIELKGHYPWLILKINDSKYYDQWKIKTYILQEMISSGIFFGGAHNISYSHTTSDINAILKVYSKIIPNLFSLIKNKQLNQNLRTKPIKPLFKVR